MKSVRIKLVRFVSMALVATLAYIAGKWFAKYDDVYPEDLGIDTDWF